jgi:hypothetical protein
MSSFSPIPDSCAIGTNVNRSFKEMGNKIVIVGRPFWLLGWRSGSPATLGTSGTSKPRRRTFAVGVEDDDVYIDARGDGHLVHRIAVIDLEIFIAGRPSHLSISKSFNLPTSQPPNFPTSQPQSKKSPNTET